MKIACVAYMHGFGGAERQIIMLANQMVIRNHEVNLICVAEDKIKYDLDKRVQIHSIVDKELGNSIIRIYLRRKYLLQKLNELKCDLIINFNFQSVYLLGFSNKNKIGKILYSERADPGDKEYSGILGIIRNITIPHIDAFVFQSEGARDFFKNNYVKTHCTVIPNACFTKKGLPFQGERDKRIVSVGRLSNQKNQKVLIKAFSKIASKYKDYELEFYGDGDLREELEDFCYELGISKQVNFKGTVKNVSEVIQSASLFVLSSDFEGIPNALIEAMAVGLPCISTDCRPGGARTLIKSGKNGIITPIGDADTLAQAMDYLLSNPKKAKEISENALNIVDTLSPNLIYDKWESFMLSTCNK